MGQLFDVCNGDADGLCAVVQWRLHARNRATLVTGLKRDIELLKHVRAHAGDTVLVCDISMRRNRAPLMQLLEAGVAVRYFDHHHVDPIPVHPLLETHIDFAGSTCSSLLMDAHLDGKFRSWALVGAFGDNLRNVAQRLAESLPLSHTQVGQLQSLGESINYNAYGDSTEDVYIAPAMLFERMVRYGTPLDFLAHETVGQALNTRRANDMQQAEGTRATHQNQHSAVYVLPDAPWSRRVMGSMGNALANASPERAHALLKARPDGTLVVSVRAPVSHPHGTVDLCRKFGGDGRAGAAGIDHLPAAEQQNFIDAFMATPWDSPGP